MERDCPKIMLDPSNPNNLWRIVETEKRYVEADGSDKRVKRVYVFNGIGSIRHTFLMDEMGNRFVDNLGYKDRE